MASIHSRSRLTRRSSLCSNSHPLFSFCLLFFFRVGEASKKLGCSSNSRKKPLPQSWTLFGSVRSPSLKFLILEGILEGSPHDKFNRYLVFTLSNCRTIHLVTYCLLLHFGGFLAIDDMIDILGVPSPGYSFYGFCPSYNLQATHPDSRNREGSVLFTIRITLYLS